MNYANLISQTIDLCFFLPQHPLSTLPPTHLHTQVTGGAVSVTTKAVEADWPELYKGSALGKKNEEYALALVERDLMTLPPLKV